MLLNFQQMMLKILPLIAVFQQNLLKNKLFPTFLVSDTVCAYSTGCGTFFKEAAFAASKNSSSNLLGIHLNRILKNFCLTPCATFFAHKISFMQIVNNLALSARHRVTSDFHRSVYLTRPSHHCDTDCRYAPKHHPVLPSAVVTYIQFPWRPSPSTVDAPVSSSLTKEPYSIEPVCVALNAELLLKRKLEPSSVTTL